jgi:hypothetical protein
MAALISMVAVNLHRIRVFLFPHYLTKIKGKNIARTATEAMLSIIEVNVAGEAESGTFIDEFIDVKAGTINEKATSGGRSSSKAGRTRSKVTRTKRGYRSKIRASSRPVSRSPHEQVKDKR